MQYKTRYRPLEKLSPDGWVDFDNGQGELFR
jgi:arginyl-tRNA--protein-N-Asp/Glu arginylyltransferase